MRRLVLALLLCAAPAFAQSPSLEGAYRVEGVEPSGDAYAGTATIRVESGIWYLEWAYTTGGAGAGIGLLTGNVLSVLFQSGTALGIAAYEVDTSRGVTLTGRWTAPGSQAISSETLTRTGTAASTPDTPTHPAPTKRPKVAEPGQQALQ